VSVLVFPELSLTGYEPDLAAELAMTELDDRLGLLRDVAQEHQMTLIVGAPLRSRHNKPALGAILISGDGAVSTYEKMHLGTSEMSYFTPGDRPLAFTTSGQTIGIAICADSGQPTHPQAYAEGGATVYAAGVLLNEQWYATDAPRFAVYAARHGLLTIMANHGASIGTYASVGKSAMWAPGGDLLVQAEGTESALLIASIEDATWRGEVVSI